MRPNNRLPEHWSKFLLAHPETGMEYRIVAVTCAMVASLKMLPSFTILALLKCKAMQTFLLTGPEITDIKVTHRKWDFR